MDAFNVPKKVNRHVLKAINVLSDGKPKKAIPTMEILHQVKYQMRNLVPIPNIDMVVLRSLKNLCSIGLIKMTEPQRYALGHSYAASSKNHSSSSRGGKLNKADSRKRSYSKLNTNVNRTYQRDDSLSNDEFYRSPKRTNSPKAFQHQPHHVAINYALDNPLYPPEIFGAGYFIDTSLNRDTVIYDLVRDLKSVNNLNMEFVDNVPVSLEITEIKNDNNSNLIIQQLIELYRNSKSTSSNSSAATRPDFTINNSEKPPSETVNSFSGTAEKSNLVVDSKSNDSNSKVN